jgi:hypothetical protein
MDYVFAMISGAIIGALVQYRFGQLPAVEAAEARMREIFAGRRKTP